MELLCPWIWVVKCNIFKDKPLPEKRSVDG
jgi:hypothetical protein